MTDDDLKKLADTLIQENFYDNSSTVREFERSLVELLRMVNKRVVIRPISNVDLKILAFQYANSLGREEVDFQAGFRAAEQYHKIEGENK